MYATSTDTFSIGGLTPIAASPADLLTLHLSEDAWNGNAQFTLSIDGKHILRAASSYGSPLCHRLGRSLFCR